MVESSEIDEDEFEFPLRISTHERCGDPCPEFRERISGREEFEFIGMWGPKVETANNETIAEGHESVRLVLDVVLGGEPRDTKTCSQWDCTNEASYTFESDPDSDHLPWVTTYRCSECIDRGTESTVYEGVETKACDTDRCFNVVHESRDYCPSHECSPN